MRPGICLALVTGIALTLSGCGGGNDDNSDRVVNRDPPQGASYQPALSISPYKDQLVRCPLIERSADACRLSTLPYIGQATASPTKADIMARVVVSHAWMGTRFSQLLDEMPDDIYQLFGSVTAVVIGADIRPSYYWGTTGAIYLDPADLWLTAAERNTISREPDYRSEFARELNFVSLGRSVVGNNYAWDYYPLDGTVDSRPLSAIVKPMASLLFHELAHANDFIPPGLMHLVAPGNRPGDQANAFFDDLPSVDLADRMPLNSAVLYGLAAVMYRGDKASDAQKALLAEFVGLSFGSDGANDPYAYSTIFEDTAMLFEEVMMKHHFGVDREIAFTDAPPEDAFCDAYVVRWGVRNRIGDPLVKTRAELITQQLLDRNDVSAYFNHLPSPTPMVTGKDWCANLAEFGGASAKGQQKVRPRPLRPDDRLPHRAHDHHTHF